MVKLKSDLMSDNYSSIWIEVGLPRQRTLIVGQTYREWKLLDKADGSSSSIPEQLNRWCLFLSQWEKALDNGLEFHLLGDLNIIIVTGAMQTFLAIIKQQS